MVIRNQETLLRMLMERIETKGQLEVFIELLRKEFRKQQGNTRQRELPFK